MCLLVQIVPLPCGTIMIIHTPIVEKPKVCPLEEAINRARHKAFEAKSNTIERKLADDILQLKLEANARLDSLAKQLHIHN